MNVLKKKCVPLLMILVLCLSYKSVAFAADTYTQTPVSPQWTNTDVVNLSLSFSGSKGSCGACVIGKTGTTEITGTVVLSRKNSDGTYTAVKTWNSLNATGNMLIFDSTYYVTTGYTYRLAITAAVYRNGTGETVSGSYEAYAG